MNALRFPSLSLALLLLAAAGAPAQMPGPKPGDLNAALTRLFGKNTAFSAQAQVRLLDQAQKETTTLAMNFAMLEGKIRAEVDMGGIKSKDLPPEALNGFKQMGMDKMVGILRPDRKSTLVIYPSLQAYAEVPLSPEEAAGLNKQFKIETTKLGAETIDGHPCVKNKVLMTAGPAERHEALVWYATDLNNFPVQMQLQQREATVVMLYRGIRLARPDAKQFEAPAGFARHESIEKLMQSAMAKMLAPGK